MIAIEKTVAIFRGEGHTRPLTATQEGTQVGQEIQENMNRSLYCCPMGIQVKMMRTGDLNYLYTPKLSGFLKLPGTWPWCDQDS